MSEQTIIMHIDVNSAFLSWQATYNLQHGDPLDLREIPSAVGGSQKDRKGIVLAKSGPAKAYGIQTGEVLWQAKEKCPELTVVPPNYELYMMCSDALYELIREYSPKVQRFSIDEMFIDYTGMTRHFGEPVEAAHMIKNRVKKELGFTVNVGVGTNKLLAKMAGDLKKPDMVHTLLNQEEIERKMWPLPVRELFMVGSASEKKLKSLNINTIGDLAKYDPSLLKYKLKSYGNLIWQYANGLDESIVRSGSNLIMKGIGNSTTIKFDVTDHKTAHKALLSLTESVAFRLRNANACCGVVSVEIRTSVLNSYGHQRRLLNRTNLTNEIFRNVRELFDEAWKGEKIRHLGVRVTDLSTDEYIQGSLFDSKNIAKKQALDSAVDMIRAKYGNSSIIRAVLTDGEFKGMTGGVDVDEFPPMSSIL